MRSRRVVTGACAVGFVVAATSSVAHAQAPTIPAIQIDGRGHGHGVGMAQDGALAMGKAGANAKQILAQFYPGTTVGKAAGNVRVPVLTGNGVALSFPEGGEVRGANQAARVPPGGTALFTRDGDGTRVKTSDGTPATTTTTAVSTTTSSTTSPTAVTTTTLLPVGQGRAKNSPQPTVTSAPPSTTTTTQPPPSSLFKGTMTVTPTGDGRVGLTPRNRRYRGVIEVTPVAGGALRFVNQVNLETYLRGMGEVRNPGWPSAGLQAQAIAARTYAMRAMSFGGELCDTQRCQVYIGADAEYPAMDKAVSATSGQVLMYGNSLASAVYSANAGGHTANREEGFGLAGDTYPYLKPTPYLTDNRDEWTVTLALTDVGRHLNYAGALTGIAVAARGPSGRATALTLQGAAGDKTVSGIEFDAALGLRSTLFTLKTVMAAKVTSLTGGSMLQAPPEEAPALAGAAITAPAPRSAAVQVGAQTTIGDDDEVGFVSLVAAALWGAIVVSAFAWRRRSKTLLTRLLS